VTQTKTWTMTLIRVTGAVTGRTRGKCDRKIGVYAERSEAFTKNVLSCASVGLSTDFHLHRHCVQAVFVIFMIREGLQGYDAYTQFF